ncbi:MAG: 2-hydroxyacyl-CoA dehydratase family protein, partial [Firmicutes bacterium]|nr:2-hydroxyacyl-CoA dehydratase family protein [Bacillota bacterium]
SQLLPRIIKNTYRQAHEGKAGGKKVVWSSGIAPVELFHAMGLVPVFPENYAAACGVKQLGLELCGWAENAGYSSDLCSYFRSDLGHILSGCTYLGGLPEPDMVVATRCLCTAHVKWLEVIARHFNCPMFVWDLPSGEVDAALQPAHHRLAYAVGQLHELIGFLEQYNGEKLDWDRLREAIRLGDRAAELWIAINESRKARPVPISTTDMLGNLFVLVVLSGTSTAVDYLGLVAGEVAERALRGIGVIPEEKFRLIWDVMPLWYNMALFDRFQRDGAVFALELYNYGRVWGQRLDPARPLESLARRHLTHIFNIDGPSRLRMVEEFIREFHIHGYVNHVIRSCSLLSTGTYHLANLVQQKLQVPALVINCDHCDPRAYSPGPVETRIQAFLEILAASV